MINRTRNVAISPDTSHSVLVVSLAYRKLSNAFSVPNDWVHCASLYNVITLLAVRLIQYCMSTGLQSVVLGTYTYTHLVLTWSNAVAVTVVFTD